MAMLQRSTGKTMNIGFPLSNEEIVQSLSLFGSTSFQRYTPVLFQLERLLLNDMTDKEKARLKRKMVELTFLRMAFEKKAFSPGVMAFFARDLYYN
jgi:hypothetical protein